MRFTTFREAPFVDREEEERELISFFSKVPQRILFVYGPKSSGKTTLIEYIVENKLVKEEKFWVKYLNLREALISSYGSFLDTFFVPVQEDSIEQEAKLGINIIGLKAEILQRVKTKQENLFKAFVKKLEEVKNLKKTPILIIDEIQKLRDIYIQNSNGERELLKEFLNFCVRLTKELHLAHVAILTSNTIFIERIYGDARLKETSSFYKVDHLKKKQVEEWLKKEGFSKSEMELSWEYLGGAIPRILKLIEVKKEEKNLKKHLEKEAWIAYTEIDEAMAKLNEKEKSFIQKAFREIAEKGYLSLEGLQEEKRKILKAWAEQEILFYDPLELKITPSSRIYLKAIEKFVLKSVD